MGRSLKTGTQTNVIVMSKGRKKAIARNMKRQEAKWQSKNGPVTVRFIDPDEAQKA
jgi:hypothetical protein